MESLESELINGKNSKSDDLFRSIISKINNNEYVDINILDSEIYSYNDQRIVDESHEEALEKYLEIKDINPEKGVLYIENEEDSNLYSNLFEDYYFNSSISGSEPYLVDIYFNQWILKSIFENKKYIFYITSSDTGGNYITENNIEELLGCNMTDIKATFFNYKVPYIRKPHIYNIKIYGEVYKISITRCGSFLYVNADKCNP